MRTHRNTRSDTAPRSRRLGAIVIAAAVVAGLSGCGLSFLQAGDRVTEEREIGDASVVELRTSGDVNVRVGDTPSLTVSGGENQLERLRTDVKGDVLELDLRHRGPVIGDGDLEFDIVLTSLEAVRIEGAGDVEADFGDASDVLIDIGGSGDVETGRLDAERVRVSINGSGGVETSGASDELVVEISGSGEVDAADLRTQRAQVRISGSANVDVDARDELDVTLSGSGTVTYTGDPTVRSEVSGSGEVVQR